MSTKTDICPCCGASQNHSSAHSHAGRVRECRKCKAIYTQTGSTIYLGESYTLVRPGLTEDPEADKRHVYFDFSCLGSKGLSRRHGWFDPQTRLITQVG